jgi:hypothetical protein
MDICDCNLNQIQKNEGSMHGYMTLSTITLGIATFSLKTHRGIVLSDTI